MAADPAESPSRAIAERAPERRRWLATGQIQGVGFRPFVYRLALDRLGVDAPTCPDCLRQSLDPACHRRHGHALITCAHCGPRYTIVRGVPCRFHTQQGRS